MTPRRKPAWGFAARGLAMVLGLALAACEDPQHRTAPQGGQITFGILSAEDRASAEPLWQPLLDDMERALGVEVTPQFVTTYADLVDGIDSGRVQAGWFSARPAIEALEGGHAELLARTVDLAGQDSYSAVLVARRGSGVTLESALACDQTLTLGMGDAASTSARLAPMTLLFAPRDIDPELCFREVRTGGHQPNAFAVAAGTLDIAAVNTVTLAAAAQQNPQIADQLDIIWRSPPLPEGAVLARTNLDPSLKERLRTFLLTYSQGQGADADRRRQTLAALNFSAFRSADDGYLDPVREMLAQQRLAEARNARNRTAARAAQSELESLRARREVQP